MEGKTKIFYLITKGNFGGAQKYVYDLATNLPQDRYEIKVIFGEGGELGEKLRSAGVGTLKIDNLGRNIKWLDEFRVLRQLLKLFRAEKPDIIHLNSSKIGALGALAGRLAGVKKIVFTAHGWAFNEKRSFFSRLAIRLTYWLIVSLCHQTIAVSAKTKDQVSHLSSLANKITVIHNGLQPIVFLDRLEARKFLLKKMGVKPSEQILSLLDERQIIGTTSELHKTKGLDFLIDAVAQIKKDHPNVLVWIMGEGEERNRLTNLIKEKGLKDYVLLLGYVDEAPKYLKAFDIFTLTSRTEALPYAILQAGQAGLPVLASCVGGIPEIISQSESGILVRPGNIRELKYALTRLLTDKKLRDRLGKNIQKTVAQKFTIKKMVKETTRLY